jgi:hypothetical protein
VFVPAIDEPAVYAYLLGLYLGDGHLHWCGTWQLRVSLDLAYPGIIEEAASAIVAHTPHRRVARRSEPGKNSVDLMAGWTDWPVLFPQCGPGPKHLRPIVLADWQQDIVAADPRPFLRGLIHSDGCRSINRFTTELPSGRVAEYAYARYFFTNMSADIRGLFCAACDQLGVRWTQSNHRNISVAHRPSVRVLDAFIGPKA